MEALLSVTCLPPQRVEAQRGRGGGKGELTESAAGLEGATLLTLATGDSGHVVSPSVGTENPLGIARVSAASG